MAGHLLLGRAAVDLPAQVFVEDHQFIDAGPSAIAQLPAVRTAHRVVQGRRRGRVGAEQRALGGIGLIRLLATRAQHPHQALGQHTEQGRREQERLDAHVHQAGNGADGGVGVQGGQHQVTGQRGLHGDLGGFLVADFADHHHVRVLPQDGAQTTGEGHLDLAVDLGLADAFEVVFDRVFNGEDVARAVIQADQAGVKGGGFTRAGGAGHQNDAVGFLHRRFHQAAVALAHAQVLQGQAPGLFIQQTQHHPLAVGRRQGGDADIHFAAADLERDAPVLGHALLGDVQLGHDLDPRHQQGRQFALGLHHLTQDAVDTKADHQAFFEGFDVDVRGVLFDRLAEDGVDQADDRRVVFLLQQVFGFLHLFGQAGQVHVRTQALDHLHGGGRVVLVGVAQGLLEGRRIQPIAGQTAADKALCLVQGIQAGTAARLQAQAVEQHAMALGKGERQAPRRRLSWVVHIVVVPRTKRMADGRASSGAARYKPQFGTAVNRRAGKIAKPRVPPHPGRA